MQQIGKEVGISLIFFLVAIVALGIIVPAFFAGIVAFVGESFLILVVIIIIILVFGIIVLRRR